LVFYRLLTLLNYTALGSIGKSNKGNFTGEYTVLTGIGVSFLLNFTILLNEEGSGSGSSKNGFVFANSL
jgi:hypothetical protein